MGYTQPRRITLTLQGNSHSPTDGTTYYIMTDPSAPNATITFRQLTMLNNCFIRKALIQMNSATATGTNEDIAVSIRVNDTTDYAVATLGAATPIRVFSNNNLNIKLTAGDLITVKIVMPTWATNPDGCTYTGYIVIEDE